MIEGYRALLILLLKPQVLEILAALEDDGGEASAVGAGIAEKDAGAHMDMQTTGQAPAEATQMVVYSGPQTANGKPGGEG